MGGMLVHMAVNLKYQLQKLKLTLTKLKDNVQNIITEDVYFVRPKFNIYVSGSSMNVLGQL